MSIEFRRKIRKWGNSRAVALPFEVMVALKARIGDELAMTVVKDELRIKIVKGESA